VKLFSVRGIEVRVHSSWLIIFLLILWSLSAGYLPRTYPDQSPGSYWAAGLVATLLFFASVLAHELSHSFVAQRAGMPVPGITLFVFGGVSQIAEEARDPQTEMRVAAVGPLCSFGLAALFWGLHTALARGEPSLASTVLRYLAWINLALGVFNLVPGFPLDGGRILRSVIWWKTGSLTRATRWAADVGKGFAYTLMALGALQIFAGALLGGLWFIFIGMFLRTVAEGEYQQTVVRRSLEGVKVGDVMVEDVVSVSPDLSVAELIDRYFLHYGYKGFPVRDGERVVGIVALRNVKHVDPAERDQITVGQLMVELGDGDRVAPDRSLADALKQMAAQGTGRLLVMEGERTVGILTKAGLARLLEVKRVLEA
jgi:Zn-dependent protease